MAELSCHCARSVAWFFSKVCVTNTWDTEFRNSACTQLGISVIFYSKAKSFSFRAFCLRSFGHLNRKLTESEQTDARYLLYVTMFSQNHSTSIIDMFESIIVQKNSTEPSRNDHQDVACVGNLMIHRWIHLSFVCPFSDSLTSIRCNMRLDAAVSPSSSQSARMAWLFPSQMLLTNTWDDGFGQSQMTYR